MLAYFATLPMRSLSSLILVVPILVLRATGCSGRPISGGVRIPKDRQDGGCEVEERGIRRLDGPVHQEDAGGEHGSMQ